MSANKGTREARPSRVITQPSRQSSAQVSPMRRTGGGAAVVVRGWEGNYMAKGGRMCCFGSRKDSLIGRVLDERGSGPKKIVGTVPVTSEASTTRWNAASCDLVPERSRNQGSLESRMLGNLHVRFGVGAGGETPPAYTTWVSNHPRPPGPKSRISQRNSRRSLHDRDTSAPNGGPIYPLRFDRPIAA